MIGRIPVCLSKNKLKKIHLDTDLGGDIKESMKLLRRGFTLMLLIVALASCSASKAKSTMPLLSTPTSQPTLTSNLETTTFPSPSPRETNLSSPQTLAVPFSITPTMTVMENGLTWTECIVPNRDYSRMGEDMAILKKCVEPPEWSDEDSERLGERVTGNLDFDDLRITIGTDYFEARLVDRDKDGFQYELTKNGVVIYKTITHFTTIDPNRDFWNIDGKLVWELAGEQSVIIVDGVDFNEKYQLEGAYFPYEIKGKLIFVAKKNGKFSIMYDEKTVGPEFDEISMPYCCAMAPLVRGNGQYWFVGSREGIKYLVSIR
jgi:hypothetical protein